MKNAGEITVTNAATRRKFLVSMSSCAYVVTVNWKKLCKLRLGCCACEDLLKQIVVAAGAGQLEPVRFDVTFPPVFEISGKVNVAVRRSPERR